MAEQYGFTADQVGEMTFRQIKVYMMSAGVVSENQAIANNLEVETQRQAFLAAYKE